MKHTTQITPLNCAWSSNLSDIITFYDAELTSSSTRKILCKSPKQSYFKMKSVGGIEPYIEPCFYGLKDGDSVTVEFEAMCISGYAKIAVLAVNIESETVTQENVRHVSPDFIGSHFKKYRFTIPLRNLNNSVGVVVNVRPTETGNSVVVIKNVEMTIDTSSANFGLKNNVVEYANEVDILSCVNYYSQTKKKTAYNTLKALAANSSEVNIVDDEIRFIGSNTTAFKGLMTMMPTYRGFGTIAVYGEFASPNNSFVTTQGYSKKALTTSVTNFTVSYPTLTKRIYYVRVMTLLDYVFVDIGRTAMSNITLKNVMFSMPQFNQAKKEDANKTEHLEYL